jgi:hypothetical protein
VDEEVVLEYKRRGYFLGLGLDFLAALHDTQVTWRRIIETSIEDDGGGFFSTTECTKLTLYPSVVVFPPTCRNQNVVSIYREGSWEASTGCGR